MLTAPTPSGTLLCERTRVTGAAELPRDLLDCVPEAAEASAYFAHPAQGLELAADGIAAEIRSAGPDRFAHAAAAARALFAGLELRGDGPAPLLLGGFGFADASPHDPRWDGFPALHFVLPARLWIRRAGETWLLRTVPVERPSGLHLVAGDARTGDGGTRPRARDAASERDRWIAGVRGALAAIEARQLRKVVLARASEGTATAPARRTVRRLRQGRDECVSFWLQRGSAGFVGSSPEVLARIVDGAIEATALAGSAPRAGDAAADAAGGRALLACPKNRGEHAFVADDVRRALASVCDAVDEQPLEVRRYPEAFHLATPFRGRLAPGRGLLDAARALHPTSAVCGTPRAAAHAMIAATEPDRGWYAGGVGWMDAAGQGTLAVALRCGLLRAGSATLWAGAGIVADSDPATEYDETETKMQAMRRALAESEDAGSTG